MVDFLPLGICFLPLEGTRKVPGSDFRVGAAFLPPGLVDAALVAERPWIQQGARRRRLIWSAGLGKPHPHHLRKPGVFLPVSVGLPSPVTAGCRLQSLRIVPRAVSGLRGGRPGFLLTPGEHRYSLHRGRGSERPPESESSPPRLFCSALRRSHGQLVGSLSRAWVEPTSPVPPLTIEYFVPLDHKPH